MGDRLGRGRAHTCSGSEPDNRARPDCRCRRADRNAASRDAQNPDKPDAAQPARSSPAASATRLPTPGIGQPDGRKGIQDAGHPDRAGSAGFHNYWLLPLCAIISVFVLALLVYAMVRFRRGANPTPSRNSHNTLIEVIWTLVPVLILVGIAIPSIRLLRHQYTPPPADLTVKVTGHQWYWSYELPDYGVQFDSYMLKEANDPTRQANQRARTDADGPPLLAVDNRLVIPPGKVVKFIVTADDVIHSFACRRSGSSRTRTRASFTRPGPRSTGRASISDNAPSCAAPATASCRSPSRSFRQRSSRSGLDRRAAICPAQRRPRTCCCRGRQHQCAGNATPGPTVTGTARRTPPAPNNPTSPTVRTSKPIGSVPHEHHRRRTSPEAARSA